MGNPTLSSVLVNGRKMCFSGNFSFKINSQEYSTKNGRVYNSKGQPLKELKMPDYIAEHFFAMSETGLGDKQESTFTNNDINYAEDFQKEKSNSAHSGLITRLRTLTGAKGKVQTGKNEPTVENGVYSSQYKSNQSGRVSTISVWLNN